mmetsp:Transcript_12708/g.35958  ORF Transcript_12708/g.35958 Transcript_12708/m.35958 type:complete len:127 (-) Transcript_12708:348-728(-)
MACPFFWGKVETEFFFKSASTTTCGILRKTVFALKFHNNQDAAEFEMWWFHFNGQIHDWKAAEWARKEIVKGAYRSARNNPNSKERIDSSAELLLVGKPNEYPNKILSKFLHSTLRTSRLSRLLRK